MTAVIEPAAGVPPQVPHGAKKWPFAGWRTIDDATGRKWSIWLASAADGIAATGWPTLGKVGAPEIDDVHSFLWGLYRARPRTIWVEATRAIAAFGVHDTDTQARIGALWQQCFPEGLPRSLEPVEQGRLLPVDWKEDKAFVSTLKARLGEDFDDAAHLLRHTLVLGCAWLSRGGALDLVPGLDPQTLAARPLPGGDESDATCILQGIAELAHSSSPHRAKVLPHLGARASDLPVSDQGEDTLRNLAESLEVADGCNADEAVRLSARQAILDRLRQPLWRQAAGHVKRAEGLWSWHASACWFQSRGDSTSVAAMAAEAGDTSDLLALALEGRIPGEAANAIEALVPRLRFVLESAVWRTSSADMRSRRLVEVAALLSHAAVRDKDAVEVWAALRARATGLDGAVALRNLPPPEPWRPNPGTWSPRPSQVDGRTRFPHQALVALAHGLGDDAPQFLLRDREFDRNSTLELAPSKDGRVAIQVAVQAELHLRAMEPADQVRFLWKLLRADPHDKVFGELALMLRVGWQPARAGTSETASPTAPQAATLRDLCRTLGRLDQLRSKQRKADAEDPANSGAGGGLTQKQAAAQAAAAVKRRAELAASIHEGYRDAAEHAATLIASTPGKHPASDAARTLRGLARHLSVASRSPMPGGPEADYRTWLDTWQTGLLGEGPSDGLCGWAAWLGMPLAADLEATWRELGLSLGDVRDAYPLPTESQVSKAGASIAALKDRLTAIPWPESLLLAPCWRALDVWLDAAKARAATWLRQQQRLHQKMGALDVAGVASMVGELQEARADNLAGQGSHLPLPTEELRRLHGWLLARADYATATVVATWLGDCATHALQAHLAERAAASIQAALDNGDETLLERRLYEEPGDNGLGHRVESLGPETIQRINHFLLRRIALSSAMRLRSAVRARVELPHPYLHLGPLLAGIVAGPVLVLDVGDGWTRSFAKGLSWSAASICLVSFLGALGLVVLPLLSAGASLRTGAPGERSFDTPLVWRVARVFGAALLTAWAASVFVLWTTGTIEPTAAGLCLQALYWTPLSLFLGLFLGLVLQGRGPAGDG